MDLSNAMIDLQPADLCNTVAEFNGRAANPMVSLQFIAISRILQRIFGKIVEQPLPERLVDLIEQVERVGQKRK